MYGSACRQRMADRERTSKGDTGSCSVSRPDKLHVAGVAVGDRLEGDGRNNDWPSLSRYRALLADK